MAERKDDIRISKGALASDVICARCGHNLRGAPITSSCPECGYRIRDALVFRRLSSAWSPEQVRGTIGAALLGAFLPPLILALPTLAVLWFLVSTFVCLFALGTVARRLWSGRFHTVFLLAILFLTLETALLACLALAIAVDLV